MPPSLHWTAGVHHDGSALFVSNPTPALGETVTISLRVVGKTPIRGVFLRSCPDGEPWMIEMQPSLIQENTVWYKADLAVTMPVNPYRFKLITPEGAYYFTALGISRADAPDSGDFKLLADYPAPSWIKGAVFYEIFPDRFHNGDPSNDVRDGEWEVRGAKTKHRPWGEMPLHYREGRTLDFYGGDLQGITRKIDYLHDLGVNALYLTPIFSARTNHRYDIMDFFEVDPHLGGSEALIELRAGLDRVNMKLILDVTLNHTGWFHPWFQAAQASKDSSYYEFFTFNNHPNDYVSWLGHASLPKWNYRSQKLRDQLYRAEDSVLRYWLRSPFRIDGWRLDVANMQGKQGAVQLGHEIGREIRAAIKGHSPEAYLLGEHFHDGTPHLQGDELDASMNYQGFTFPVRRFLAGKDLGADWNANWADTHPLPAEFAAKQISRFMGAVPWVIAQQQFNLLGSHDTTRIMTVLDGDRALTRLAVVLLMTFPGVPCIYYGDEIGMTGGNDPFNRACMIWEPEKWDRDLYDLHRKLAALRKSAPALREGGFQVLYAEGSLLVYQRQSREQQLVVIGWRGGHNPLGARIPLWPGDIADGSVLHDLISGTSFTVKDGVINLLELSHGMGLILEVTHP